MNDANQRPGQAAAAAAGMNESSQESSANSPPAEKKPLSKVTMRVSLKAPTPGAGPASLAPDPRRDVLTEAATAPVPMAQPTPMAAPLEIAPVLNNEPKFGSMNEVTASPAPMLVAAAPPAHQVAPATQAPAQPAAAQAPAQPAALAAYPPAQQAPAPQPFSKPKANKAGTFLNAICIILGIVAVVLFAFMLIE